MRQKNGLTEQQEDAIRLIAEGAAYQHVADKLGVTRKTIWVWRQDEDFARQLEQARAEVHADARERLTALVAPSIEALAGLLKSDSETVRHKAACSILDRAGIGVHQHTHTAESRTIDVKGLDEETLARIQEAALSRGGAD